ncbi:hypothetical protein BDY24DRAFT_434261 [Mrakia frigida]|uniref:uncharacterized protein n=1 Tax=Mrakia frigida TaxID=29902 RepID=UPI003FCC1584
MKLSLSSLALVLSSVLLLGGVDAYVQGHQSTPTHFHITVPSTTSPWVQGGPNPLVWESAIEGVVQFDVELVRLAGTGLLLVAKNVPLKDGKAVVDVEGIPEGDDYFCVFMDSYDGTVYARSSRFSIQANNTVSTTVSASLTMTITGSPHPTRMFETTLLPVETKISDSSFYGNSGSSSSASRGVSVGVGIGGSMGLGMGVLSVMLTLS